MYKLLSMGLLGLLAVMVIPVNISEYESGIKFYGAATILVRDSVGNEVFSQTIHNRLFDAGESFILNQTFTGLGSDVADNVQIGAICLSADTTPSTTEADSATTWNNDNTWSGGDAKNCRTDGTVTNSTQIATIGPLTFTAGADSVNLNWVTDETITNIAICSADVADANVTDCATTLFAVVDTSNVQLGNGETVDITYTFDITSSTT